MTVRSRGVGEALMHEAEAWAASRGLPATSLYTSIKRDRAHAFYERLGYRIKGTSHLMGRPSRALPQTYSEGPDPAAVGIDSFRGIAAIDDVGLMRPTNARSGVSGLRHV